MGAVALGCSQPQSPLFQKAWGGTRVQPHTTRPWSRSGAIRYYRRRPEGV